MQKCLWTPSDLRVREANITAFKTGLERKFSAEILDYATLYRWSLENNDLFWSEVWDFTEVVSSFKGEVFVQGSKDLSQSSKNWFPQAKLNFAENLLRFRGSNPAIISIDEMGRRRELSYESLYLAVASLVKYLKSCGIKCGDRVCAVVSNRIEVIVSMLATTAIGAIWSSASPDFGAQALKDRFEQIAPAFLFVTPNYSYNGKCHDIGDKIGDLVSALKNLKGVIVIGDSQSTKFGSEQFESVHYDEALKLGASSQILFPQFSFAHPIYILFSSGTTGRPKAILHGAGGTLLEHLKELVLHVDLKEGKKIFYYTTCGWMMWNWLVSSLAVGATVVIYDGAALFPNASRLFDLIDSEGINIFGISAKYLSSIAKEGLTPKETHRLISLETICSTGSPLNQDGFQYVYDKIKDDLCLSSISGGTDIIGCFALGNVAESVYAGELQVRSLGLKVEVYNEEGRSVVDEPGELVCTNPFPSMPLGFFNDDNWERFREAYFNFYPGIWRHGDWAKLTAHGSMVIYGRSDSTLNPSGVRIGTSEIYREVERFSQIEECVAVSKKLDSDEEIFLFVLMRQGQGLTEDLIGSIKQTIKSSCSPRHVPAQIISVPGIPKTLNNKISEAAVRDAINGREIKNKEALSNPEVLEFYVGLSGRANKFHQQI